MLVMLFQPRVLRLLCLLVCFCASTVGTTAEPVDPYPSRIISLAPHITELLYAIGAERQLIATVDYSDHPRAALALPRVGNVFALDWERLLAFHPDLLVVWDSVPASILARLKTLNVPLVILKPAQLESIAADIRRLGQVTGNSQRAEQVAAAFLADLQRLKVKYAEKKRLRVFIEISHRPIYTINGEQIISHAVRLCGGENVFSDLGILAPVVGVEAVLQAAPEVMIYAGPEPIQSVRADWARWPSLPVPDAISPDILNRATPRMLQGIQQLCTAIQQAR